MNSYRPAYTRAVRFAEEMLGDSVWLSGPSWDMMYTGRKAELEPPTLEDRRRRQTQHGAASIDARQTGFISQQLRAQTTRLNLKADIE